MTSAFSDVLETTRFRNSVPNSTSCLPASCDHEDTTDLAFFLRAARRRVSTSARDQSDFTTIDSSAFRTVSTVLGLSASIRLMERMELVLV